MIFDEEYAKSIAQRRGLKTVKVTLIEKHGKCPHEVGDFFLYFHSMARPAGICGVAAHTLEPFVLRCSVNVPSWEENDPSVYLLHCPSKKGTIWKIEKV